MTGPLAPSLRDQVVNHVIGSYSGRTRHVPPGEAERRPGSPRAEVGVGVGRWQHVIVSPRDLRGWHTQLSD
eukprot:4086552-Prymnesium_polylepis.1